VSSAAEAPVGAPPLDSHPACRQCGCLHRFTKRERGVEVTYDAACPCGCTANADAYARGIIDHDLDGPGLHCSRAYDGRPIGGRASHDPATTTADDDDPGDERDEHDNAGLGVHQAPRERGSVQHTVGSERGVRDRVHVSRAHVAIARLFRRAVASPSGDTGSGSSDAVRPVRLDAVEQRSGVRVVTCTWCDYLRSIGHSEEYVVQQHAWGEAEYDGHDGTLPEWLRIND
jgi:hypothetical protein